MKKHKIWADLRGYLIVFLIFLVLCAFVVTTAFLIFFHSIELTPEQIKSAAPITFISILLMTAVFVAVDTIRRKISIDRPIKEIQDGLKQITKGNFQVRLDSGKGDARFRQIKESINAMTAELSGIETLRTDFVSNVSHEMQTPLSIINNYGTLLQNVDLTDEQRMEYAKVITASAKRLAELMTNILKLNRLENQTIYPESRKYNLSEQLCQDLLQFEQVWEEKDIEVDVDIPENITITADPELLTIVWTNLLSNAFKFTDKGGKVTISLTEDDHHAIIKVADTGCGMSQEVGRHIFEKFYQGDTSHATQGNGLGLSLVKRIIDITAGEISVSSTVGVGSIFMVKLPKNINMEE